MTTVEAHEEALPAPQQDHAMDVHLFEPPQKVAPAPPPVSLANGMESIHSFSVEPILDIRQQAEFFVSLGQTERALQTLRKQISSSTVPNPFIYLDLLALFHSLGMKADFREYRNTFNRFFTGAMPDFPAFHLEGEDLLAYPEVLARLVQGWPSANSLVLLDGWIFRKEKAPAHASFDLAAFRDLLMLHALAEEVATDLPWETVSPALGPDVDLPHREEAALITRPAESASARHLPQELQEQSLDMDFSAFETGPSALDATLEAQVVSGSPNLQVPKTAPSARWPTTNKPS